MSPLQRARLSLASALLQAVFLPCPLCAAPLPPSHPPSPPPPPHQSPPPPPSPHQSLPLFPPPSLLQPLPTRYVMALNINIYILVEQIVYVPCLYCCALTLFSHLSRCGSTPQSKPLGEAPTSACLRPVSPASSARTLTTSLSPPCNLWASLHRSSSTQTWPMDAVS